MAGRGGRIRGASPPTLNAATALPPASKTGAPIAATPGVASSSEML